MATRVESREQEFERLYERYVADVYRYALAVLRNPADAEDVTQTAFMNAYRAFKAGEEPVKPQNWLIKIAHNACRTRAIRAARRPREVPLDDRVHELAVPEQERPNVEAVLAALGKLPFNQRSALVLRELEGRSYEEIAEALGVSVSAVETLIFRARRSLRLKRDAFRGLAAVPIPASLQTFGGGAAATGGTALLGGVAAKVAVVAAALLAGGAGYQAADGADGPQAKQHPAPAAIVAVAAFTPFTSAQHRLIAAVRQGRAVAAAPARAGHDGHRAPIRTLPVSKRPLEPGSSGHDGGHAEPAPAPPAAGGDAGGSGLATSTTAAVTAVAAKVVSAAPVQVPSVQVPSAPAVSVPAPPVPAPDVPAAPAVSVPAPPAPAPPIGLP